VVVRGHEAFEAPRMFWPLVAYAAATLVASLFSVDPPTSLIDWKSPEGLRFSVLPAVWVAASKFCIR